MLDKSSLRILNFSLGTQFKRAALSTSSLPFSLNLFTLAFHTIPTPLLNSSYWDHQWPGSCQSQLSSLCPYLTGPFRPHLARLDTPSFWKLVSRLQWTLSPDVLSSCFHSCPSDSPFLRCRSAWCFINTCLIASLSLQRFPVMCWVISKPLAWSVFWLCLLCPIIEEAENPLSWSSTMI